MKSKGNGFNISKATILCQVLVGVLHTLREFFIPLIGLYLDPVILQALTHSTETLTKSKKRQHHQTGQDWNPAKSEKLAY